MLREIQGEMPKNKMKEVIDFNKKFCRLDS